MPDAKFNPFSLSETSDDVRTSETSLTKSLHQLIFSNMFRRLFQFEVSLLLESLVVVVVESVKRALARLSETLVIISQSKVNLSNAS